MLWESAVDYESTRYIGWTTGEDEKQMKDGQTTNDVHLTLEPLIFSSVLLDSAHDYPQNQTANSVCQDAQIAQPDFAVTDIENFKGGSS